MPKPLTSRNLRPGPVPCRLRPLVTGAAVGLSFLASCALSACTTSDAQPTPRAASGSSSEIVVSASDIVIQSPKDTPRPPFRFSAEDEQLLDDVQHGAFLYLWNEVSRTTGMVQDRSSKSVISIAGVGFQLSAIPVAVERHWISREEAHARTMLILRSLLANPDNRKAGLFYHFLDAQTAGPAEGAYEHTVSTIDSAILFAGVITAGSYFGDDVQKLASRIIDDADWRFFILTESKKPYEIGYISLGWQPTKKDQPTADGKLLPYVWADAGDEHRLVTFLAAAAPKAEHRVEPELYYKLRRQLGDPGAWEGGPTDVNDRLMVWFPWSGALFTNFFAHCWMNYSALEPDRPAAFGHTQRARVDWWENARRAVKMHQRKCTENPKNLPTFSAHAWGLSASDVPSGYGVPGLFPDAVTMKGAKENIDYAKFAVKDDYGDGTVAPYAAGCSILFDPAAAIAALRYYQSLKNADGSPMVWREPDASKRQYGFQDAFNLGKQWVAPDCVAIDQGPLLLAIENARTGKVWDWFERSPVVVEGYTRLKFK